MRFSDSNPDRKLNITSLLSSRTTRSSVPRSNEAVPWWYHGALEPGVHGDSCVSGVISATEEHLLEYARHIH